uniref:Uncharacterized protein n=1 Tax=Siphoviridae sp. ct0X023 TaxID=2825295 RepID=A0A8S5P2P0_9CAUD|nr:MAG TPA: hypothetical protein [Siphoviridae sp. ct0X023]
MQGAGGIGKHNARGNRRIRDAGRNLRLNHHLIHAAFALHGQLKSQGFIIPGCQHGGNKAGHLGVQGFQKSPFVNLGKSFEKDISGHLSFSYFAHDAIYWLLLSTIRVERDGFSKPSKAFMGVGDSGQNPECGLLPACSSALSSSTASQNRHAAERPKEQAPKNLKKVFMPQPPFFFCAGEEYSYPLHSLEASAYNPAGGYSAIQTGQGTHRGIRRFLFRATPECCHPGQGQECALFPSPS